MIAIFFTELTWLDVAKFYFAIALGIFIFIMILCPPRFILNIIEYLKRKP